MRTWHQTLTIVLTTAVVAAWLVVVPVDAQSPPPQSSGATVSITIGSAGGGGPTGGLPREVTIGDVVMNGLGYPNGVATVRIDGSVAATLVVSANGRFTRTFTGLPQGLHTFGVSATDARGLTSPTISLTLSVPGGTITTIDNLFLPPTINASSPVILPDSVSLSGYSYPGSTVLLMLSVGKFYQTPAHGDGTWTLSIPSRELGLGSHQVRVYAKLASGLQSEPGTPVVFLVLPAALPPGVSLPPTQVQQPAFPPTAPIDTQECSDLNGDGRVNLTDFSILLYYWGRSTTVEGAGQVDCSGDGTIDLKDLSVMLYWWTG